MAGAERGAAAATVRGDSLGSELVIHLVFFGQILVESNSLDYLDYRQ